MSAGTGLILTGTCSWTEKTLVASGEFYPREVRTAEARLRYYTSHFPTVEVDSAYYAIPARQTTALWAARTPEDFVFHIKAYGGLTGHGIDPKTLSHEARELLPARERTERQVYIRDPSLRKIVAGLFAEALRPLRDAGKLGIVICQFPPWFQYGRETIKKVIESRDDMAGIPVGVEFRHGSWLTRDRVEETLAVLRDNGLTYIAADEPQYGDLSTVPFIAGDKSETGYVRLHGRNRENWRKKGIDTPLRYSYLYSEDELRGFLPSIRRVAQNAKRTYVMFNNCHGGFAVRNAFRMQELIRSDGAR